MPYEKSRSKRIALESIRKIMKQTAGNGIHIEHAGIFEIEKYLEKRIRKITELALKKLDEENQLRDLHNLPRLKRLSHLFIQKVLENE